MTTMREQFGTTACTLLDTDPDTAVVLAVISRDRFPAHPRVFDVGITEQAMIGVAAGLALTGYRPIAHTITPFLVERPYEMIKLDLVMHRLPATLVSTGGSYDYPAEGHTHHGPADVAVLAALAGVEIAVPGSVTEIDAAVRAAHASDAVSYVRLSERDHGERTPAGPGVSVLRRGARGTVLAVGPVLRAVLDAAAGLDLTVAYTTGVRPFDRRGLAAAHTGGPVTIVEPYAGGVLLPEVLAALGPVPVTMIGVPLAVHHHYGTIADHDRTAGLDAASIRARLLPAATTAA